MSIVIVIALVLLFYNMLFYMIGDYISRYVKIYHKTVIGFFVFFLFYFIIATPISVLRLNWNIFFTSMIFMHSILFGVTCYMFVKDKRFKKMSIDSIFKYFKKYSFLIGVILLFIVLYLGSDRSILGIGNKSQLTIIDSAFYLSKAVKVIGVEHIGSFDPITGKELEPIGQIITSLITWEYLWSFISVITGLKVVITSKVIFSIMVLSKVVLTFSEVFEQLFKDKKKTWSIFLFVLLLFALYTMPDGHLQNELAKYFYLPFYGNVITTTVMIPILILIFYKALENKKYFYLLFIAPLPFFSFSAGATIIILLTYPILILLWYFLKQYKIKHEILFVSVSLLIFILLNYGYIKLQASVTAVEWVDWMMFFYHTIPVFFLAFIGFVIQYHQKKLKKEECTLIFFFLIFFFLCVFEKTSLFMFLKYKFSLRRYLIGASLFFFMYGISYLYDYLKSNVKSLIIGVITMFLFLQKLYTPVLIQDRPYFHFKENILNINRVAPESEELVKIIDERAKEKKLGYCYFLSYYDVDGIQLSPNRTLLPSVDLRALAHKNAFDVTYAGGQEVNPWERTENCSIFITDHREYMKSAEKAGGHEIANIHSERMPLGLRVYEFKK